MAPNYGGLPNCHSGPLMSDGKFHNIGLHILNMYSAGGARPEPRKAFEGDPLFSETSELLKPLDITEKDKDDIIAFLGAISRQPLRMSPPERIDD